MKNRRHIGIGNWTEDSQALRLVVTVELRVGDMAGDLAPRGFQTVEHEPCPEGCLTASFTHETINRRHRRVDWMVSGGAGIPDAPVEKWDDGWDRAKFDALRSLAGRWHLNTLKAGCAHQEVAYEEDRFGRTVPSLDLTPPCPLTGYRYGTSWLVEPLPSDVLDEILAFGVALPEGAASV